jgi:hypothetical protein
VGKFADIKNETSTIRGIHHGNKDLKTELDSSKALFLLRIKVTRITNKSDIPYETIRVQKLPTHTCCKDPRMENPELLKSILPKKNCEMVRTNKIPDGRSSRAKLLINLNADALLRKGMRNKKSAKAISKVVTTVSEEGSVPNPILDCRDTR